MARTLKTRGLEEIRSLRSRVRRQLALQRIAPADFQYIDKRLDEIEARIISMREYNEQGREE